MHFLVKLTERLTMQTLIKSRMWSDTISVGMTWRTLNDSVCGGFDLCFVFKSSNQVREVWMQNGILITKCWIQFSNSIRHRQLVETDLRPVQAGVHTRVGFPSLFLFSLPCCLHIYVACPEAESTHLACILGWNCILTIYVSLQIYMHYVCSLIDFILPSICQSFISGGIYFVLI